MVNKWLQRSPNPCYPLNFILINGSHTHPFSLRSARLSDRSPQSLIDLFNIFLQFRFNLVSFQSFFWQRSEKVLKSSQPRQTTNWIMTNVYSSLLLLTIGPCWCSVFFYFGFCYSLLTIHIF